MRTRTTVRTPGQAAIERYNGAGASKGLRAFQARLTRHSSRSGFRVNMQRHLHSGFLSRGAAKAALGGLARRMGGNYRRRDAHGRFA